jgi:hypothetical protein
MKLLIYYDHCIHIFPFTNQIFPNLVLTPLYSNHVLSCNKQPLNDSYVLLIQIVKRKYAPSRAVQCFVAWKPKMHETITVRL